MTKSRLGVALATVTVLVGMLACSSSGNGSCLSEAVGSDCYSCVQSNCGSELSTFESSCNDYLSCVCLGGNFSCSARTSATCQQKEQESSCDSAGDTISNCSQQKCESVCSSGDTMCEGDGGVTTTVCDAPLGGGVGHGSALDAGVCANGQTVELCTTTAGSVTTCYYSIGFQQFACNSCSDTTGCAQAASAACE